MSKVKCPLCSGTIKKINHDKAPMIKCEKNIKKGNISTGCKFFMNLKPKALKGYEFKKEEIIHMLEGGEVDIKGVKATYDINFEFSPKLVFPELEDY